MSAITRVGLTGSMAAYGAFTPKAETLDLSRPGYAGWQSAVIMSGWLFWLVGAR